MKNKIIVLALSFILSAVILTGEEGKVITKATKKNSSATPAAVSIKGSAKGKSSLKSHLVLRGGLDVLENRLDKITIEDTSDEQKLELVWFDNINAGGELTFEINKNIEAGGGFSTEIFAKKEAGGENYLFNIPFYGIGKITYPVTKSINVYGAGRLGLNMFGVINKDDKFENIEFGGFYFGLGAGAEYDRFSVECYYRNIIYYSKKKEHDKDVEKTKNFEKIGIDAGIKIW